MRPLLLAFCAAGALAADFPEPFNTEPSTTQPMPAEQAAATMKVPPGFHVSLFAGEPDVQQPIAMATDARGRLWVAECYTYAESKVGFEPKLRDRIVIFEDTKNSGHFDKRTVFWDQGQRLTSIELGFGGVWAACAPNLLFIPDRNGDDIPDGPPEVVLDGWNAGPVRHNIVNGLRWGPDGWLYGRHGILATSHVGAPGTPDDQRTPINCGIWRYHPARKIFEVVASGTTNPWGMDWNEVGEAFFTNTVIGHLWHLIPGAHYQRMYGEDLNPHTYQLMPMCADHYHFDTGAGWTKSRAALDATAAVAPTSDALGGGHAHCGCLIYQGDQWPAEYRGKLLTINFHGRRINVDRLERSGSGYVAKHEPDFLQSADPWFRGIDLIQAPDGSVFLADWSDAGECHDNDGVHRTSGRIFKITYGEPKAGRDGSPGRPPDIAKLDDSQLIEAQSSKNEWLVRTARRVLQERAANGVDVKPAQEQLRAIFDARQDTNTKLRAMWGLHATNGASGDWLRERLADKDEQVRAWSVRLLTEKWPGAVASYAAEVEKKLAIQIKERAVLDEVGPPDDEEGKTDLAFQHLVRDDPSPVVRLALASALQRMPKVLADHIATWLGRVAADETDPNIPFLLWYGIEPLIPRTKLVLEDDRRFLEFSLDEYCRIGLVRRNYFHHLAERLDDGWVSHKLKEFTLDKDAVPLDVLDGLAAGLAGQRKATAPKGWSDVAAHLANSPDERVRTRVRELGAVFGDGRALDEIRTIALDETADLSARRQALQSLTDARVPELRATCEKLLSARGLGVAAARGLAVFDDPKIGALLIGKYGSFQSGERSDVIGIVASRPAWAGALLDAMAAGSIERGNVSAFHARQIRSFNDPALTKHLAEVWGEVRSTDDAKRALIAKVKALLTAETMKQADVPAGRALFAQTCAVCHRLYGEGAEFGPDLTGSGRHDLSYLLENIADPSAIVPADFRLNIVTLKDGRVLSGVLGAKTERTLAVRSAGGSETVERTEIAKLEELPQSPMPEGLLLAMNDAQVRDLIAYLMTDSQVPLPAAK